MAAGIEKDDPWFLGALEGTFDALAIEPARGGEIAVDEAKGADMGVDAAVEALCKNGECAEEARGGGGQDKIRRWQRELRLLRRGHR